MFPLYEFLDLLTMNPMEEKYCLKRNRFCVRMYLGLDLNTYKLGQYTASSDDIAEYKSKVNVDQLFLKQYAGPILLEVLRKI